MRVTPDAPREAWGLAHHGQRGPHLDPAVLHATPSGLDPALTAALPGLCFPQGIRPELLERTPSMSELTEVVCGQAHHSSDEATFVFTLKARSIFLGFPGLGGKEQKARFGKRVDATPP